MTTIGPPQWLFWAKAYTWLTHYGKLSWKISALTTRRDDIIK